MRTVWVATVLVLGVAVGWLAVAAAAEPQAPKTVPAKPVGPADPSPKTAPPDQEATVPTPRTSENPPSSDATPRTIDPPPPLPDVSIPPIPEVGDDPFKPGPPPVRLKPPDVVEEGKRLFNREGRLELDKIGRATFVFDSGDKPMHLLECSWREYLETVTDYGKKKARWRISGLVTVYGKQNYLLLSKVVRIMPEEEDL